MNGLPNLCHITPDYNAPSILKYGISSSPDGYIYLFQDGNLLHKSGKSLPMSDTIALLLNKIQTNHYFKFSIDPKGFKTLPERDNNANTFGGGYHWKVRQESTKSEFIKVVDYRAAIKNDAIELRNMFMADQHGITYVGQSYQRLCRIIMKRHELPGGIYSTGLILDGWEHEDKPPTVTLDNRKVVEIINLQKSIHGRAS